MGGRGSSLSGSSGANVAVKDGTVSKKNETIENPSLSDMDGLKIANTESFTEQVETAQSINNTSPYYAYISKPDGSFSEIRGRNSEELEKNIKNFTDKGAVLIEKGEKDKILSTVDKKIDYNEFYTIKKPIGETEKAFKIEIRVDKQANIFAFGGDPTLVRTKGKERNLTQFAFIPKSATKLVKNGDTAEFKIKGWALDKMLKSQKEYWGSRFGERYSAVVRIL